MQALDSLFLIPSLITASVSLYAPYLLFPGALHQSYCLNKATGVGINSQVIFTFTPEVD